MTVGDILQHVALSATVFVPVAGVSLAVGFLVTRVCEPGRPRRRRRTALAAASLLVAASATALFWANRGALGGAETYRRVFVTLLVPLVVYLVELLLLSWVARRVGNDATRLTLRKAFIYVGVLAVILVLINVWLLRERVDLVTVLSVVGAGLALALHQVLLCCTGWLFLLIERRYGVGDRVQIGEIKGDVSDIGIFHTTLVEIGNWVAADQSTGRLVSVPNSFLFTQPVFNYTKEFEYIWNEVSVLVTFESDWRRAQQILLETAQEGVEEIQERFRTQIRRMARKYMILYQHLTPIVYPRILDSGVQLTLRYLTEPKRRRGTEAEITSKVLDAFAREPHVEFAYPTTRFYDATQEGKATRQSPE
ncbi:MAG: mechanosensitive ion channel family protein [Candidatus Brocadiia bacterium]